MKEKKGGIEGVGKGLGKKEEGGGSFYGCVLFRKGKIL